MRRGRLVMYCANVFVRVRSHRRIAGQHEIEVVGRHPVIVSATGWAVDSPTSC